MSHSMTSSIPAEAPGASRQRIICGIRPTGSVHIGNYYGAIKPAVELAKSFPDETLLFIADLHALTEIENHHRLAADTLSTAALYIAAVEAQGLTFRTDAQGKDGGITLFVQSHVTEVSEMARLLGSITGMGMLNRMIQFKEKSAHGDAEAASLTLFDYPVLMAADILLYQASHVPVGEDQRQHLELARELAQRCNRTFGTNLAAPQAYIGNAARIKSLLDGTKKMSKSEGNDNSRINLLDDADTIRRKIKKAKTDSIKGLTFDDSAANEATENTASTGGATTAQICRPEVDNLLGIYALASGQSRSDIAAATAQMGTAHFKELLSEALVRDLGPVQEGYTALMKNPERIMSILRAGANRARTLAAHTLTECRAKVGLLAQ